MPKLKSVRKTQILGVQTKQMMNLESNLKMKNHSKHNAKALICYHQIWDSWVVHQNKDFSKVRQGDYLPNAVTP